MIYKLIYNHVGEYYLLRDIIPMMIQPKKIFKKKKKTSAVVMWDESAGKTKKRPTGRIYSVKVPLFSVSCFTRNPVDVAG